MSDADALDERLRAVERALTDDDDSDLTDLRDAAELTREVERLAERLDDAEERLDELDAATQALRGYVGNVRAVNESVERRADTALAKAEALEADLPASDSESCRASNSEPRPRSDPETCREPDARTVEDGERRPRSNRPCRCERGRLERTAGSVGPDGRTAPTESGAESGRRTDSGLLARITQALTGAL